MQQKQYTLVYLQLSITKLLVVSLFHHVSHCRGSEYSILQYCKYLVKENPLLLHLRFFKFLNSKKGTIRLIHSSSFSSLQTGHNFMKTFHILCGPSWTLCAVGWTIVKPSGKNYNFFFQYFPNTLSVLP